MKTTHIEKLLSTNPPEIRVTPLLRTKYEEKKAKLIKALIEYNWSEIDNRIQNEIIRPLTRCIIIGQHSWRGFGIPNKHICKNCGWKTSVNIDPVYASFARVSWDGQKKGKHGK